MCTTVTKRPNILSSQGFTLLELAMAMAILGVVAIYTLDMYQSISGRKRLVDNKSKMEEISTAFKTYYSGHEGLPIAGTSFPDSIPIAALGMGQIYRFDSHGRPYLYFPAVNADDFPNASGFQVDGRSAAGVVISLGEDQLQSYTVDADTGTIYTTAGDDILYPIEVHAEAVAIALSELESLGKRVEAYNRDYAGVDQNPDYSFQPGQDTGYYGDETSGAPPIINPDNYDEDYQKFAQLYPYNPYYPISTEYSIEPGPPPTNDDLAYDEPDQNWPDPPIYNNWPNRPPDPPTGLDLPPPPFIFSGWSGPGFLSWPPIIDDVFGEYNPTPYEEEEDSYELIDEGGCQPSTDPNCVFVILDASGNPIQDIVTQYGLGSRLLTDPWGNLYQWGSADLNRTDPRYHLFFSAGPDRTTGTDDDIILY